MYILKLHLAFNYIFNYNQGVFYKFDCEVHNKNYLKSITWTYNGGSLPTNAEVVNNSLILKKAEEFNEGKYMCEGKTSLQYAWSYDYVPFVGAITLNLKGN